VINPLANYMPARAVRAMLRFGRSRFAEASWNDPGGWRSMVLSYDADSPQLADKILISGGTMPMALRNRKRLAGRVLARLINHCDKGEDVHVLCLGAGPGAIIMDAICQAQRPARATLVDINTDAFEYGRRQAAQRGIAERVRFIQSDVREMDRLLDSPPDIVKMLGICEYLPDDVLLPIAQAAARVMPGCGAIVLNSLEPTHGVDRFFRRVMDLHMIHRTPAELIALMGEAGFSDFLVFPEPLGVFNILVGRRISDPAPEPQKDSE